MVAPVIFGIEGLSVTEEEMWLFDQVQPWGFILFARNIIDAAQVLELTADLRDCVRHHPPILIDQEGGSLATRLHPPLGRDWPDAREFVAQYPDLDTRCEAMYLRYRIIAGELMALGINVNCAPIADLIHPMTHAIIRDRAYGESVEEVVAISQAVADGLMAGGVLPVLKHIPGHGRATVDSHRRLPLVDADLRTLEETDFAVFRALSDLPMGMTAHIRYAAIDDMQAATVSRDVIDTIRNEIGFGGLLMSDDICMKALDRRIRKRAAMALEAGCDIVLHCNGHLGQMRNITKDLPPLRGAALERAEDALAVRQAPDEFDVEAALKRLEDLKEGAVEYAGGSV